MTEYLNLDQIVDDMEPIFDSIDSSFNRLQQIEYIASNLSPVHAWLRLLFDYNYQVNNGGHNQYLSNGYHTTKQTNYWEDISTDTNLLDQLIHMTIRFQDDFEHSSKLLYVLQRIRIEIEDEEYEDCYNCHDGTVTEEVWNEETEEEEEQEVECPECCGDRRIRNENYRNLTFSCNELLEKLDDELYAFNDKMLNELDQVVYKMVEKYKSEKETV